MEEANGKITKTNRSGADGMKKSSERKLEGCKNMEITSRDAIWFTKNFSLKCKCRWNKKNFEKEEYESSKREDGLTINLFKGMLDFILYKVAQTYTKCVLSQWVPEARKIATIIRVYKKINLKYLENHRSVNLLSATCKLFSKIITKRVSSTLNSNHLGEQVEFRYSKY